MRELLGSHRTSSNSILFVFIILLVTDSVDDGNGNTRGWDMMVIDPRTNELVTFHPITNEQYEKKKNEKKDLYTDD